MAGNLGDAHYRTDLPRNGPPYGDTARFFGPPYTGIAIGGGPVRAGDATLNNKTPWGEPTGWLTKQNAGTHVAAGYRQTKPGYFTAGQGYAHGKPGYSTYNGGRFAHGQSVPSYETEQGNLR